MKCSDFAFFLLLSSSTSFYSQEGSFDLFFLSFFFDAFIERHRGFFQLLTTTVHVFFRDRTTIKQTSIETCSYSALMIKGIVQNIGSFLVKCQRIESTAQLASNHKADSALKCCLNLIFIASTHVFSRSQQEAGKKKIDPP